MDDVRIVVDVYATPVLDGGPNTTGPMPSPDDDAPAPAPVRTWGTG